MEIRGSAVFDDIEAGGGLSVDLCEVSGEPEGGAVRGLEGQDDRWSGVVEKRADRLFVGELKAWILLNAGMKAAEFCLGCGFEEGVGIQQELLIGDWGGVEEVSLNGVEGVGDTGATF